MIFFSKAARQLGQRHLRTVPRHFVSTCVGLGLCLLLTSCTPREGQIEDAGGSSEITSSDIQIYEMGRPSGDIPSWAIGPFSIGISDNRPMIFRPDLTWKDPEASDAWEPANFWNPTLIVKDEILYMFYRTGPLLEGLESRIGLAWSANGVDWEDYENNPVIYPTEDNEIWGVEDPRIYSYGDTYYLYYGAVWDTTYQNSDLSGNWKEPDGVVAVDISLATSSDLLHWEKRGVVVPRSVSNNWAKAAVIPRSPEGEAIKIDGQFMMFISERMSMGIDDVDEQVIGYSTDLINWEFEQKAFMLPDENIHSIYEVASATTNIPGNNNLVMDVFYRKHDGSRGCSQVLYDKANPTESIAFSDFGLCTWGGISRFKDNWIFAQGWVEPEALYLYTAPFE